MATPHADLIAQRINHVLHSLGHESTLHDCAITIPKWRLRVDVHEGETREHSNGFAIFPAIISAHHLLPRGFARELGVGIGDSVQRAADAVSTNWMLLFFPR
jgi:hypothetical protein